MKQAADTPREPSGRSLGLRREGYDALNRNHVRTIVTLLKDERIVTPEGRAAICGALVALGNSTLGKVQAMCDLGDAAREILSGIPQGRRKLQP